MSSHATVHVSGPRSCACEWFWETEKCCSSEDSFFDDEGLHLKARLLDSVIMLRYTIKNSFCWQERRVSRQKNLVPSRQCAVNGVTFHRIFRLVDPFVKVHILIIKLDRFSLAPFLRSLSVVVSPPHGSMTTFSVGLLWGEKKKSGFPFLLVRLFHVSAPGGLIFY